MKKLLKSTFIALLVVVFVGGVVVAAEYRDGEYIGFVPDDHGDVVVAIGIQQGYVTNVEIISPVKHNYKYKPGQNAFYDYPQKVLKQQTANIDIVSKATSSYTNYNKAVQMCLDMASGNYKGNKFYGLSRDYNHGHTLLELTLNNSRDKIKKVKWVTKNSDDENVTLMEAKTENYPLPEAVKAFNKLPQEAVEKQSIKVDIVSGATHISSAFYQALLMAVDAANADIEG